MRVNVDKRNVLKKKKSFSTWCYFEDDLYHSLFIAQQILITEIIRKGESWDEGSFWKVSG